MQHLCVRWTKNSGRVPCRSSVVVVFLWPRYSKRLKRAKSLARDALHRNLKLKDTLLPSSLEICQFCVMRISTPGTHSQILMTGGGGIDRGSYFVPKKITTSEFVYPKKSLFFQHTQKNPLVLFSHWIATQKNIGVFHGPKKIPFAKISAQKNHSDLPVIKICEWGPWDLVSQSDRVTSSCRHVRVWNCTILNIGQ